MSNGLRVGMVLGIMVVLCGCAGSRVAIPEIDLSIRPVSVPGATVPQSSGSGERKEGGS